MRCKNPRRLEGDNKGVTAGLWVRELRCGWDCPEEMLEDGIIGILLVIELKAPVGCLRKDEMQDALDRLEGKIVKPRGKSGAWSGSYV